MTTVALVATNPDPEQVAADVDDRADRGSIRKVVERVWITALGITIHP